MLHEIQKYIYFIGKPSNLLLTPSLQYYYIEILLFQLPIRTADSPETNELETLCK